MEPLTETEANEVYNILMECVGASPAGRDDFVSLETYRVIDEYRFIGSLGFGGKYWRDSTHDYGRVSMYSEDRTPSRVAAMHAANEALIELGNR